MELKQGAVCTGTLVTGERAVGFYDTTSPRTGSHLLRRVTTEDGKKAEYAWAQSIDSRFDNGLASRC